MLNLFGRDSVVWMKTSKESHTISRLESSCKGLKANIYKKQENQGITLKIWFTNTTELCQQLPAPYKQLSADNYNTYKQ